MFNLRQRLFGKKLGHKKNPRIVTFGSCLSFYTAREYVRLFGGKVVSTVYHNRSDAFVGKMLDKAWPVIPMAELQKELGIEDTRVDKTQNIDSIPYKILRNQFQDYMGLHRLPQGTPLFEILESQDVDIIIVDNYMDLSARLAIADNDDSQAIFLTLNKKYVDVKSGGRDWQIGGFLPPAEGVRHMRRILDFFHKAVPGAHVIFMHFPHSTYADSPERVARTKEYEALLSSHRDTYVIPCLNIRKPFRTQQKQHFATGQYCAYAAMVHQYVTKK